MENQTLANQSPKWSGGQSGMGEFLLSFVQEICAMKLVFMLEFHLHVYLYTTGVSVKAGYKVWLMGSCILAFHDICL